MEQNKVLEITLKNGRCATWGKGEWDSYFYDGSAIIIKKRWFAGWGIQLDKRHLRCD